MVLTPATQPTCTDSYVTPSQPQTRHIGPPEQKPQLVIGWQTPGPPQRSVVMERQNSSGPQSRFEPQAVPAPASMPATEHALASEMETHSWVRRQQNSPDPHVLPAQVPGER